MASENKKELRYGQEIRAESSGNGKKLEGYCALYNTETTIGGDMFRELIKPGAFDMSLKNPNVYACYSHDDKLILGHTQSGTLRLRSDSKGLFYSIDLPDTQTANDLWTSVKRGDIRGASFGFIPEQENWVQPTKPGQLPLREIEMASIFDVSPCVAGAYPQANVAARSVYFPEGVPEYVEKRSGAEKYLPSKEDLLKMRLHIAKLFIN
jgi:uncharacterized protein